MPGLKYNFLPQRLPLSKKNEQWRKDNVDAIISRSRMPYYNGVPSLDKKVVNYKLYNGFMNKGDFEHITNPYDIDDVMPMNIENYNIIKSRIDYLIGQELKRKENCRVVQVNPEAITMAENLKKKFYYEMVNEKINKHFQNSGILQPELDENGQPIEGQFKTPEEIEKYFMYSYRDMNEVAMTHGLEYLKKELNTKFELNKGWKDLLIAGEEFYWVGIVNGEPALERVNPIEFDYDKHPNLYFIDDASWCCWKRLMTPAMIVDCYADYLTSEDLQKIDNFTSTGQMPGTGSTVNYQPPTIKNIPVAPTDIYNGFVSNYILVYNVEWISMKKIGFLTSVDEDGEVSMDIVDETYKPEKGDDIKWTWVTETWEGTKIGDDIWIKVRPVPNQNISINNLNNAKLSYTGVVACNTNAKAVSMVDIMKPYQYLFNIIKFKLALAIGRDKGKVFLMDITQIPSSMGIDLPKWMHYLSSIGIGFINPFEEGAAARGGAAAGFNQFQSVDLTMAPIIDQYIRLLDKIETDMGRLCGVNENAMGQTSTNELVGNANRNIVQSSYIIEHLFYYHNEVKKRAYTKLLEVAKFAWQDGRQIQYVTDDMTSAYINLAAGDLEYSDLGIYMTDSSEDTENMNTLKHLAQASLNSGAPMSMVAEMITSNSPATIVNKIKTIEAQKEQIQQAAQQAERQKEEQLLQIKLQAEENTNRIIEEDSIRKSNTQLEMKLIDAEMKEKEIQAKISMQVPEAPNYDYQLDMERMNIEREKLNEQVAQRYTDAVLKNKDLDVKEKLGLAKVAQKPPKKK